MAKAPRVTRPPRWPTAMLALFAILATVSLLQGWVDVVLPVVRGEPMFGFLFAMTERFGMPFFALYIFVHNLGLASLVPGYGFLAAWFERRTVNRFIIGILLAVAVLVSILVAANFVLGAHERFDLPFALALLVGEACGVLALAIAGARELRGFVPTPAYDWSLIQPFRNLRTPFLASAAVLAILSLVEAAAVSG